MRAVLAFQLVAGCGAGSPEWADGELGSDGDADSDARNGPDSGSAFEPGTDGDPVEPDPDPGRECTARSENVAPSPPVPIYPDGACLGVVQILKAENATDADGDVLRYHFQVDVDYTFDEFDLQGTSIDGIAEGSGWFTWWRPPMPLGEGQEYWWRVWVDDCFAQSEPAISFFRVCAE